jgi:hypothetical protein
LRWFQVRKPWFFPFLSISKTLAQLISPSTFISTVTFLTFAFGKASLTHGK